MTGFRQLTLASRAGVCGGLFLCVVALALPLTAMPAGAQGGASVHQKTTLEPAQTEPATETEAPRADTGESAPDTEATASAPDQDAEPSANPLGAGWQTDTQPQISSDEADLTDEDALALIQQVNIYFNDLRQIRAEFVQIDAGNKRQGGKFYFSRPGRVRFDYNLPSKMKIISDGQFLAVENHDLRTTDRYPLEATPFRLLLSEQVDLLRDARILAIDKGENVLIITMEDKSGESPGRIRLFFEMEPEMMLKSWIITDPQGFDTRVDISKIEANVELAADLFQFSRIGLPDFRR
jgi:outer membrane lipoprotein-sorting protein